MVQDRNGAKPAIATAGGTIRSQDRRRLSYGVALLCVALALAITLLLGSWISATPAQLFFVAVMVSAWYGGLGPGLLATALSTLAVNYFLIEPYGSLSITNLRTVVQMGVFVIAALLISGLNQSRHMALRQARANLSERQQAEAALQESTAILNVINQTSPTLIFVKDRQGRVLMANPATLAAIGQPAAAVIGRTDAEFHRNPQEGEQMMANDRQVMQTGQVQVFEEILEVAAGRRSFLSTKSPYRDPQGNIIGLIGVAFDTTDRQQAEAALQESEVRFQQMAETIDDVFWLFDPQSQQMLYISPAYEQIWGRSCESLYRDFSQWIETIHPDDRAQVQTAVSQCLLKGSHEVEYRVMRPDGSIRWVRDRGYLMRDAQGQPHHITGVAQDLTDRQQSEITLRQSEARYRSLVELIPQLVWSANAEGLILDVNQRWLDFTGVTLAQVQQEGWQAIIHPDDLPGISQQWAAAQHTGTAYRAEGRIRRIDGAYCWHLHQAVPLRNEQGQVRQWFGTATDVSEQKQLEQQRDRLLQREQAAREAAEAANRIKDEFLAVVSHELRSPLNPILGWSKLLRSRQLDPQKTEHALETIERNAQMQAQLINDLLDVSRILRGKLTLEANSIDLVSTIQAAMETVRLAAEARSIHLHTQFEPAIGYVTGDAGRLQQVVWNLLSNAVKFTPPAGQIEIRLEKVKLEEDKLHNNSPSEGQPIHPSATTVHAADYAQITISDTGKGIHPDFLPYVFDRFRQEDATTTRRFGGLGLGLAIVRYLVELHGGTVQADSLGAGQGATFTVRLPLKAEGRGQKAEGNHSSLPTPHPLLAGLRILLVDDETDTRELLAFTLEQNRAIVTSVASALEGLQLLIQTEFDLLISDIGMPEMDGYMLMQQVRAMPAAPGRDILAIALTAYAGEIDQKQALQAGFQRHIVKPIAPDELIAMIAALVREKKAGGVLNPE